MNNRLVYLINDLSTVSQKYSLPGLIQVHIIHLNHLAQQWSELNQPIYNSNQYDSQKNEICDNIQKYIAYLIGKISNHGVPVDLIQIFSEVVVNYMDANTQNEAKMQSLVNFFGNMTMNPIDNPCSIPNNFIKEFSKFKI